MPSPILNNENDKNPLITLDSPVNIYSSINFLPPYLQKQKLLQDLCFFFDYLGVDIETAYNDLRYKYLDWTKVSETGAIQTLTGMGMDYIVDLIEVISPSNSKQLLALCSVIWLLKGQLLGVDIIASVCGFNYTVEVWHEQVPLGEPNTATIHIDFVQYRSLSEDFQHNFVEFLRKYLYPVITASVVASPMEGELHSYGFMYGTQQSRFIEIQKITPVTFDCIEDIHNPVGTLHLCHVFKESIRIDTTQLWETLTDPWSNIGYYAINGIWGAKTLRGAYYESPLYDLGALYVISNIQAEVNWYCSDEAQNIKILYRSSEGGLDYTDWIPINSIEAPTFQYCQFRVEFNNINDVQMLRYSFKVTLL